eukprot:symbB.v1.2.017004.t1/scaffold1286.1/size126767/6
MVATLKKLRRHGLSLAFLCVFRWTLETTPTTAFFDFFANDKEETKVEKVATATYAQLKVLTVLRKWEKTDSRWKEYCRGTGFTQSTMPTELVQDFILEPKNYKTDALKSFTSLAKLPSLMVEADEEEEFGGFMDSNRFGFVKSEKQLEAEQAKLAKQVSDFLAGKAENAELWKKFVLEDVLLDPDDAESRAVRGEMATRSELGRRKTALESFLDAESWQMDSWTADPMENHYAPLKIDMEHSHGGLEDQAVPLRGWLRGLQVSIPNFEISKALSKLGVALNVTGGFCRGAELEEFRLIDASADEKHMAFTIHMDLGINCLVNTTLQAIGPPKTCELELETAAAVARVGLQVLVEDGLPGEVSATCALQPDLTKLHVLTRSLSCDPLRLLERGLQEFINDLAPTLLCAKVSNSLGEALSKASKDLRELVSPFRKPSDVLPLPPAAKEALDLREVFWKGPMGRVLRSFMREVFHVENATQLNQVLRFLQHDLGLHSWQHGGSWEVKVPWIREMFLTWMQDATLDLTNVEDVHFHFSGSSAARIQGRKKPTGLLWSSWTPVKPLTCRHHVQKYLPVWVPFHPVLHWQQTSTNLGQKGAQWSHQAPHGFGYSIQRAGDHGNECEHDIHHLSCRFIQDFGHQTSLPRDDHQEPEEVLHLRGHRLGRQGGSSTLPRLQLSEHHEGEAVHLYHADAIR